MHDGFVYLWSINLKSGSCKLQFSNKVTSFIQNITWMGSSVITVGTRHAKVWRLEQNKPASSSKKRFDIENGIDGAPGSPVPRTFSGRNCLLGPLIDAAFTCVAAISDSKAILCTDKGDVCLLDDTERTQRLNRITKTGSSILCLTVDIARKRLWMGGTMGKLWALPLDLFTGVEISSDLLVSLTDSEPHSSLGSGPNVDTVAMGYVRGQVVTVESDRSIRIRRSTNTGNRGNVKTEKRMPAHDSGVLGVSILHHPNDHNAEFFTWSAQGTVIFWLLDGTCKGKLEIPLDQPDNAEDGNQNELKVVRSSESNKYFVSGDKLGVLRLIDRSGENASVLRAHKGDILDIALARRDDDDTLIVSCGRDRTLQLFRESRDDLTIQQTLDDHAASVCNVMFTNNGTTMLSSSSDRTIIVRSLVKGEAQEVAFIPTRVITLKASPMAFSILPGTNVLLVSTIDRQIHKYDLSTGRLLQSFKALDHTGSDSLVISSLSVHRLEKDSGQIPIFLGVSSTDKSISAYNYDSGSALVKEYGQTVISDVAYIQQLSENGDSKKAVISTGLDGTIMIWDLTVRSHALAGLQGSVNDDRPAESLKTHVSTLSLPLRRILSKSEIQDFQKSLENDADAPTPSRDQSQSRIRKKISRYTMANTPKVTFSAMSASTNHPPSSSSATEAFCRKISQDHSSAPPSPKQAAASVRSRRSSLDGRHRRESTSNLNDLNVATDQICKSLRTYRKKISSLTETMKRETAEELVRELELTINVIGHRATKIQVANGIASGDLLDAYLAKMIDERLAVKNKPEDDSNAGTGAKASASPSKTSEQS